MKKIFYFVLLSVIVCSCGAYKRLGYVQDMQVGESYDVTQYPKTRVTSGDELRIRVYSSQPELAAPFNIGPSTVASEEHITGTTDNLVNPVSNGIEYTVDTLGCIIFPVLGRVYVEGMTLDELSSFLAEQIKATNFLKDPMVKVEICNFQITVIGETGKGNYLFPKGNVNIFELMAQVGDLTEDAQRDNVWVIRTIGDTRKVYSLNLKSKDVFDSPAFYLQQKDMVYVLPRKDKIDKKIGDFQTWIALPFSLLSTLVAGAALILSILK